MFSLLNHVHFLKSKVKRLSVLKDLEEGPIGYCIFLIVHLTVYYVFLTIFKD